MAQVPATMRAAVLTQFKQPYKLIEKPVPKVSAPQDILVRIRAAGFCHSDLQVWEGVYESPLPLVGSHEPVGEVVEMGEEARQKSGFKVGDRIGLLNFKNHCGKCHECTHPEKNGGNTIYCDSDQTTMAGIKSDGGFAEYCIADYRSSAKIPDRVPYDQAAPLFCAGATMYGAITRAREGVVRTGPLLPGKAVIGVVGIGGLGHIGVQLLRALGFTTVAIDNRQPALDTLDEIPVPENKPDLMVLGNDEKAEKKVKDFCGEAKGLDSVLVATDVPEAFKFAMKLVRKHGSVVMMGVPTDPIPVDAFPLIFNDITLKGSLICGKPELDQMMEVVAKKNIWVHTNTYKLDDINEKVLLRYPKDKELKGRLVVLL